MQDSQTTFSSFSTRLLIFLWYSTYHATNTVRLYSYKPSTSSTCVDCDYSQTVTSSAVRMMQPPRVLRLFPLIISPIYTTSTFYIIHLHHTLLLLLRKSSSILLRKAEYYQLLHSSSRSLTSCRASWRAGRARDPAGGSWS